MRLQCTIVFEKIWGAINATDDVGERRYRYIILEGSSRSSKTLSTIDCIDIICRKEENKRVTAWRDTKKDARDTILKDTLKRLKTTGRYKLGQEYNKTESFFKYSTESSFEIHGTDDEEKVHGLEQDIAWVNEPYKISKDTFDQLDQRTSDFMIIDWNPKKAHWIDDLKKDPRAIVIHSTFKDNPFCPREQRLKILSYQPVKYSSLVIDGLIQEHEAKDYDIDGNPQHFTDSQLKELTRCRENEDKKSANEFNWQVYGLGLKAEKPNRIFRWEEIPYEDYLKINSAIYTGVDWGIIDPWGILEAKYYDGALYLHEKNYLSETEVKSRLTITELAQINKDDEGLITYHFKKIGINMSSAIVCDTNRPLKIAALRRVGYNACPATNKAILDGISLLNNIRVYYTSNSPNLKYEQENYSRKVDRYGIVLEEPEDMDNHLMDPARYIAFYLQSLGIIKRV